MILDKLENNFFLNSILWLMMFKETNRQRGRFHFLGKNFAGETVNYLVLGKFLAPQFFILASWIGGQSLG